MLNRWMARHAAILILGGLVTGGLVSSAMTGKSSADPHAALASHLNALLGAFWVLGVAWSLPLLRFGETGKKRLAWAVVIPQYANWLITALKAFLHVAGVGKTEDPKNNLVLGLLSLFVVIPSLAAAGGWVYGLTGKPLALDA